MIAILVLVAMFFAARYLNRVLKEELGLDLALVLQDLRKQKRAELRRKIGAPAYRQRRPR